MKFLKILCPGRCSSVGVGAGNGGRVLDVGGGGFMADVGGSGFFMDVGGGGG
jgi:hypothetical protein